MKKTTFTNLCTGVNSVWLLTLLLLFVPFVSHSRGARMENAVTTNTIMAKEIGGEHYRLNKDEFAVLSNQFQISGIPRYFLVNQEGVIVDENASRPSDRNSLIKKIEELLK